MFVFVCGGGCVVDVHAFLVQLFLLLPSPCSVIRVGNLVVREELVESRFTGIVHGPGMWRALHQ